MSTALSLQENVSLQAYNTLAIAVSSRWFVTVNTDAQIEAALQLVKEKNCPLLVIGGGSNIVLVDDFPGLTIHINTRGCYIERESEHELQLSIAAGENWHDTVMYTVQQGWYGLENLALIPGSVGAAPVQNIGAYGVEIDQCLDYLEVIDIRSHERLRLSNVDCQFAYRDSIFKHLLKDQVIITRVVLTLSKRPVLSLNYPALQQQLASLSIDGNISTDKLTSEQVAQAVIAIRQSKLPDPADIPNAGSFFKNPIVDHVTYQKLREQYPEMVAYPVNHKEQETLGDYKLAAGWLIDHAGWKGKWLNQIAMHDKQALVLTNPYKKSGTELLAFVDYIITDIQRLYGVCLEVEPRIYRSKTS